MVQKNKKILFLLFILAVFANAQTSRSEYACPSDMVFVKGGVFTMGCTDEQSGCERVEHPAHTVAVDDFCIGKYEVTQKAWKSVMGSNPSHFKECGDDCPVEYVSWNDVQEYILKLNNQTGKNYRLPTEAEWEYAARGGNNHSPYNYSGSNNLDSVGWNNNNSDKKTHRVGQKAPNELGIYDMSGNVWEWVSDWYGDYWERINSWYNSDYYGSDYGRAEENNPKGPDGGTYRALRGGSCFYKDLYSRVSNRSNSSPDTRSKFNGFRLAISPSSP